MLGVSVCCAVCCDVIAAWGAARHITRVRCRGAELSAICVRLLLHAGFLTALQRQWQ